MAKARSNARVRIVYNKFPAIVAALPEAGMGIVQDTLSQIQATVASGMAAGGSGEIYTRGGVTHQASAPGEMPAVDTGALLGSLQVELEPRQVRGYYFTVMESAPHLEYGTVNMEARPFMAPAAAKAEKFFMKEMKDLEKHIRTLT